MRVEGDGDEGVSVEVRGFEDFVAARGAALLRTAFLLTGDRHLAEDVVQDALSRVIGRWSKIVAGGDPEPYVRRVIYSVVVDRSRRRSSRERVANTTHDVPHAGQEDIIATRLTLQEALLRLTIRQRQVLVLRFYEDLSEAQAAEIMACSAGTVKSQTAHALTRLRTLNPELAVAFGRASEMSAEVRL
jgi:RNA polymerase sigma-70 factor (sigma-E family)